jgi:cyclopropane fatty-acyl-phospholipid synthase-like methyltransferase
MSKFRRVDACRICGNTELVPVLQLGDQYLTGVFPKTKAQHVTHGPLEVVKCTGGSEICGLMQLQHSYDPSEMYGDGYGYRSALNRTMVDHLRAKAHSLCSVVDLQPGDMVLDIGSNDGTLVSFFPPYLLRVGMDPSAAPLRHLYSEGTHCLVDFFSKEKFVAEFGAQKAKIITSIAMFYDLDSPQEFVNDIAATLADDGIWHFEQSYMPLMLETAAYDTICHEHVEYYALSQVGWLLKRAGLRLLDVQLNDVNGGSFAVTACSESSALVANQARIDAIRENEKKAELGSSLTYRRFSDRARAHRYRLLDLIGEINQNGRRVLGYGASTKGNVILQFCGFTESDLTCMAEVNSEKFGCFTPGTLIPIVPEEVAHAMAPDYFLAMPWHFRANLLEREASFLKDGGKMIFPLPEPDVVGWRAD